MRGEQTGLSEGWCWKVVLARRGHGAEAEEQMNVPVALPLHSCIRRRDWSRHWRQGAQWNRCLNSRNRWMEIYARNGKIEELVGEGVRKRAWTEI
jgi:hypothetical protein